MQLGRGGIVEAFESGQWEAWVDGRKVPNPPPTNFKKTIGPNSIDVTLGQWIYETQFVKNFVDPLDPNTNPWQDIPISISTICEGESYVINPGQCILACTRERFDCSMPIWNPNTKTHDHFKQDIDGRSTVGRLFLAVHMTAGFGDYGFQGAFTLEIKNLFDRPIKLYPGMRIAQVFFTQVGSPGSYSGAYSSDDHYNMPVMPVLGKDRFF